MTDVSEATGRDSLGRTGSPLLAMARLAIGVVQGATLWWLYRSAREPLAMVWPATQPEFFGPLAMILVMVPVLLLAGVGRMRWPVLLAWAVAATAFLGLLGWHGVASQGSGEYGPGRYPPFLPWPMPLFAATALFIGHHLVLPADLERKWIAAFPTYFDTAWKAGVQLALSIGFTGAFWLLLFLGAALFNVIGLEFLGDLIAKDWFSIPVTTVVFATAVHLTDVRDGLIRGVRSVVLMLLSWLLLLMTVLAAGFLAALPFTGLDGLWETGSATALVLSAAAALIILINTAYQDGRADNLPPAILRVDRDEGEGALQSAADVLHRDGQVDAGLELLLEPVGRDLGVGVGGHLHALGLEAAAELGEVLDDAVVHQGHAARPPEVGVRVAVGRRAVRGPAGVADAGRDGRERRVGDGLLEVGELAGALVGDDRPGVDERDPRGVVSPVLQPAEPLDDDALGRPGPHISHDSAHEGGVYRQAAAHPRPAAVPQSHPCPRSRGRPTAARRATSPRPTSSSSGRPGPSSPARPRPSSPLTRSSA